MDWNYKVVSVSLPDSLLGSSSVFVFLSKCVYDI